MDCVPIIRANVEYQSIIPHTFLFSSWPTLDVRPRCASRYRLLSWSSPLLCSWVPKKNHCAPTILFMNSALTLHTQPYHPTSILRLRFALKERNIEDVRRNLHDISRAASVNCGKHWRSEDSERTFVPSDGTVHIVGSSRVA